MKCTHAKSLLSCPTLCDPMDCSPPSSSVRGLFWVRTLEWVAMPSSGGSSRPGIRPASHAPALAGGFSTTGAAGKSVLYENLLEILAAGARMCPLFFAFAFTFKNVNSQGFPAGPVVKDPPCNAGDISSIPSWGRSHVPRGS